MTPPAANKVTNKTYVEAILFFCIIKEIIAKEYVLIQAVILGNLIFVLLSCDLLYNTMSAFMIVWKTGEIIESPTSLRLGGTMKTPGRG